MKKVKPSTNGMMRKRIDELVRLTSFRYDHGQAPYTLFLGAGCSVTSGYMPMQSFMQFALNVEEGSIPSGELRFLFDELWRSKSPSERYAIFKSSVRGGNRSEGYFHLGRLIKKGYFNIVFTTNMDSLLEDSLRITANLISSQLRVLVLPDDSRDFQSRLYTPTPRVKVVKLHGDAESFLFPFTLRETREIGLNVERVLREFFSHDLIIVGSKMQDWDIQRCLPNEGGSIWFVGPNGPPREVLTTMSLRNCENNIISGSEYGTFDRFFEYMDDNLIKSPFLPKTLREWNSQFSSGDLSGIESVFGPYGFEDGQLKFPGEQWACIVLRGFWGRNVQVNIKFKFIDPTKGNRNDWLGVWARGRDPFSLKDGNLVYVRKDGRVHIFSPELRDLETASEQLDTSETINLSLAYRDKSIKVRANNLEVETRKENVNLVIDRDGVVFVHSYKATAKIEEIKASLIA